VSVVVCILNMSKESPLSVLVIVRSEKFSFFPSSHSMVKFKADVISLKDF